jgi:hypothetical protein
VEMGARFLDKALHFRSKRAEQEQSLSSRQRA